jgi:hypothetical protein
MRASVKTSPAAGSFTMKSPRDEQQPSNGRLPDDLTAKKRRPRLVHREKGVAPDGAVRELVFPTYVPVLTKSSFSSKLIPTGSIVKNSRA